jgi:hypothetical protein
MRAHPRLRLLLLARRSSPPRRLSELAPQFREELRQLLDQAGHPNLALQIATLQVVERCPCRDLACASFYTVPPHRTLFRFGRGGYTIHLAPTRGALSIDVLDRRIVAVEVLNRPDLWDELTPPR